MIDKDKLWKAIQDQVTELDVKQMGESNTEERAVYRGAIKALYSIFEVLKNSGSFDKPMEKTQFAIPVWQRNMYSYDKPSIGESEGRLVLAMKGYAIDIEDLFDRLPKEWG